MNLDALSYLDAQLSSVDDLAEIAVPESARGRIASTIYAEVSQLDELDHNVLRERIALSPERYLEEMAAFQSWMDFASASGANPVIVRAQVITQLYVGFVWLRDSLLEPVQSMLAGSVAAAVVEFLGTHPS